MVENEMLKEARLLDVNLVKKIKKGGKVKTKEPNGLKTISLVIIINFVFLSLTYAANLEEYYPLKEGNSWNYAVMEGEATFNETVKVESKEIIDGKEIFKLVHPNESSYISLDSQGIKIHKISNKDTDLVVIPPREPFS